MQLRQSRSIAMTALSATYATVAATGDGDTCRAAARGIIGWRGSIMTHRVMVDTVYCADKVAQPELAASQPVRSRYRALIRCAL